MLHDIVPSTPVHARHGGPAWRMPRGARLGLAVLALVVGGTVLCGLPGLVDMHAQDAVIAFASTQDAPDAPESLAGAESALGAAQRR